MKTHICIKNGSPFEGVVMKIKKGDCVTLNMTSFLEPPAPPNIPAYKFEEDMGNVYAQFLFLPIPPEKTVYVAVSESIVKETEQLILS